MKIFRKSDFVLFAIELLFSIAMVVKFESTTTMLTLVILNGLLVVLYAFMTNEEDKNNNIDKHGK